MAEPVIRRQLRVANRNGLHVRPASALVEVAKRFRSRIALHKGQQSADAKSMIELLALGAGKGTVLTLEVCGSDAQAAADAIEEVFLTQFRSRPASPGQATA